MLYFFSFQYPFPSITKRPSQNRGMNKSNKIQLSLSLHEDVKLKETENAWKPVKLAKKTNVDMNSEEKKTEVFFAHVLSLSIAYLGKSFPSVPICPRALLGPGQF